MAKAFTEEEKNEIREKLIEACKNCWSNYGYQKTGIRDLSQLAGISSGMFYQFFPAKEYLFVETSQSFNSEILKLFSGILKEQPNKKGVARCLKEMIQLVNNTPWLANMRREWPIILRRLPEDVVVKDYRNSFSMIGTFIENYQIRPKKSIEEVTQIINVLLSMARSSEFIPGNIEKSTDFIIDTVIDELFE